MTLTTGLHDEGRPMYACRPIFIINTNMMKYKSRNRSIYHIITVKGVQYFFIYMPMSIMATRLKKHRVGLPFYDQDVFI